MWAWLHLHDQNEHFIMIIIIIIIIIISIIALIIIKTKYECESDLRNNEHYLSSSKKMLVKKSSPVQDLNPWPLQNHNKILERDSWLSQDWF